MITLDIMQNAANLKELCEKVSNNFAFPIKVELHCETDNHPEIILNEMIVIEPYLNGNQTRISYYVYFIEEKDNERNYDLSIDAINYAFKSLILNDLNIAIDDAMDEEIIKEEYLKLKEDMIAVKTIVLQDIMGDRNTERKEFNDLLDPL